MSLLAIKNHPSKAFKQTNMTKKVTSFFDDTDVKLPELCENLSRYLICRNQLGAKRMLHGVGALIRNELPRRICANVFEDKTDPLISRMPMFEHKHPREEDNWWHFWRNCSTEELMVQMRKQISFMVNVAGPLVDEGRTYMMMKDMMKGVYPFRGFDNGFNGAHPDTAVGSEYIHMLHQAHIYYMWFVEEWISGTFDITTKLAFDDSEYENGVNLYQGVTTSMYILKNYIPRGGMPVNHLKIKKWVSNVLPVYQEPVPEYEEPVPIYDADSPPDYDSDDGFVTADEGWWDGKDEEDEDDYNPEDFCVNCPKPVALNSEYCSYCLTAL